MSVYTIAPAVVTPSGDLELTFLDDTGARVDSIVTKPEDVLITLVELYTAYDFAPFKVGDIVGTPLAGQLVTMFKERVPQVSVHYDRVSNEFAAQVRNGDTGQNVCEYGKSFASAIANLLRGHDFKSQLPKGGPITMVQWVTDFVYGFERISNELLEQEMEAIYNPDKGAW